MFMNMVEGTMKILERTDHHGRKFSENATGGGFRLDERRDFFPIDRVGKIKAEFG